MKCARLWFCKGWLVTWLCLFASAVCLAQVPGYVVNTVAGNGGPAATAPLAGGLPGGIALDPAGNIYISDGTTMVYKLSPQGTLSAFAGGGKPSQFLGDGGPATMLVMVPSADTLRMRPSAFTETEGRPSSPDCPERSVVWP
ncbi:MAG TPA: hypothetical protein VMH28_02275 [Candidatus Acidoferrales bacterium]|nr:hypothetical protein [Candidatus Acidoferrales bacterium]